MDQVFPLLSSFEVRASKSYDLAGLSISFGAIALLVIAAGISMLITLVLSLRQEKISAMTKLEEKYPGLFERLRTAYDNASVNNLIVTDLLSSVAATTANIASSALFVKKRAMLGIFIILISAMTTAYVVNNDIRSGSVTPGDWKDLIDNVINDNGNSDELLEFDNDNSNMTNSGSENLTGDISIIVVEGTPVDLTLPPGTGAGFGNPEDSEEADTEFDKSSPYEISVISSQAYYEELPEGYESVIKSYFEEMAQE
ncbi:MAG: hypothetical protein R2741_01530 [Methanolobus sp.]